MPRDARGVFFSAIVALAACGGNVDRDDGVIAAPSPASTGVAAASAGGASDGGAAASPGRAATGSGGEAPTAEPTTVQAGHYSVFYDLSAVAEGCRPPGVAGGVQELDIGAPQDGRSPYLTGKLVWRSDIPQDTASVVDGILTIPAVRTAEAAVWTPDLDLFVEAGRFTGAGEARVGDGCPVLEVVVEEDTEAPRLSVESEFPGGWLPEDDLVRIGADRPVQMFDGWPVWSVASYARQPDLFGLQSDGVPVPTRWGEWRAARQAMTFDGTNVTPGAEIVVRPLKPILSFAGKVAQVGAGKRFLAAPLDGVPRVDFDDRDAWLAEMAPTALADGLCESDRCARVIGRSCPEEGWAPGGVYSLRIDVPPGGAVRYRFRVYGQGPEAGMPWVWSRPGCNGDARRRAPALAPLPAPVEGYTHATEWLEERSECSPIRLDPQVVLSAGCASAGGDDVNFLVVFEWVEGVP